MDTRTTNTWSFNRKSNNRNFTKTKIAFLMRSSRWTMVDIKSKGISIAKSNINNAIPPALPIKQKYNNTKTNGFDSKKEANRYDELLLQQKAGIITALSCQLTFKLSVCNYIADFVYYNIEKKKFIVEDVKGMKTQIYILKKKMMKHELDIDIQEV